MIDFVARRELTLNSEMEISSMDVRWDGLQLLSQERKRCLVVPWWERIRVVAGGVGNLRRENFMIQSSPLHESGDMVVGFRFPQ